jgi:transposase-like protein
LFLNGVSTLKRKGIARDLFGKQLSAQSVNNAFSSLDKELARFRDKRTLETVVFLSLDGITQKVREIGIEKDVILRTFAMYRRGPGDEQPLKEILAFQLADVEDETSEKEFIAGINGWGPAREKTLAHHH